MRATAITVLVTSVPRRQRLTRQPQHPGARRLPQKPPTPSVATSCLSVGDTRDHRRQHKDPALKNISVDFLLNLLSNMKALGLDNHGILTTQSLCGKLQQKHCLFSCAWTTLLHDHPASPRGVCKPETCF